MQHRENPYFYFIINVFSGYLFKDDLTEFLGYILILIIGIKMLKLFQKPLFKKFLVPGRFFQKYITTREPDEEKIEVALSAIKMVTA